MKTGTPTGTIYMSKAARHRYGRRMRAEEERWRSLNGPVIVTRIEPRDPAKQPRDPANLGNDVATEALESVDDANTGP